jgi:hypothetical protein
MAPIAHPLRPPLPSAHLLHASIPYKGAVCFHIYVWEIRKYIH